MGQILIVIFCLFAACEAGTTNPIPAAPTGGSVKTLTDLNTGAGMPAEKLRAHATLAARDLIKSLGQQQTYAMLGWQVEPDYEPMQHCFEHWYDRGEAVLSAALIEDCELHVKDLSRLYASYGVHAKPVVFKSRYYWDEKKVFDQAWPGLVKAWEDQGGSKEDASYLKHPGCTQVLQTGWTGSDYFYGGEENPICRSHKIEAEEKRQDLPPGTGR